MAVNDNLLGQDALEQARMLVSSLEEGDAMSAQMILDELAQSSSSASNASEEQTTPAQPSSSNAASLAESMSALSGIDGSNLFVEIGKLTRDLHEALNSFQFDSRIADLAAQDIPDAKERLAYVITMTEQAANRTMDAIERTIPLVDTMQNGVGKLLPGWQRLIRKELQPGEFRDMCKLMDMFLRQSNENTTQMHSLMTEVLMAQDYQDLTGQIIRRVIQLVQDVEQSLVRIIRMFGAMGEYQQAIERGFVPPKEPEGPVIDHAKRDDVVTGQDDVDDLLSSLGF